jgi:hypothetical protein
MKKIKYNETESFKKDFKQLKKKFRTLAEDLEIVKKYAIELLHLENIDNQSVVLVSGVNSAETKFYKIRKFACKALKGRGANSGIRMIYGFCPETMNITFIEIYFKADQVNENKQRIRAFLKLNEVLL